MRTQAFFILAIVLAVAFAEEKPLKGSRFNSLAEIDEHPFGKTLMSHAQLHMATNGPIEEINALLVQIRDDLFQQQKSLDTRWEHERTVCSSAITSLDGDVVRIQKNLDDSTERNANAERTIQESEDGLSVTNDNIDDNTDKIETGIHNRDYDHNIYVSKNDEYDELIAAIDEAINLLKSLGSQGAFIQVNKEVSKIKETMIKHQARRAEFMNLYTPVIQALAELSEKDVDPEQLQNVISLLGVLRKALADAKNGDQAAEDKAVADWEQLHKDLLAEKNNLHNDKSQLLKRIQEAKATRESTEVEISTYTGLLQVTRNALSIKTETCNADEASYNEATTQNGINQDVVDRLIQYFTANVDKIADYIRSRVNN
jgi:chromosome segregation ATPase